MKFARVKSTKSYLTSEAGAAAAEFALVSLIFISMMLGVIDMARYAWEFNSAKAAARAGARIAVVSPPAVQQLVNYDAVTDLGIAGGTQIDNSPVGGARPIPDYSCVSTGCTPGTRVKANFDIVVNQMRRYYPKINDTNVRIEYKERGLGVAGNPMGTDVEPLISVSLRNLTFKPISLKLFNVTFNLPTVTTTLTAEDLA